jgi:hypothetical protein
MVRQTVFLAAHIAWHRARRARLVARASRLGLGRGASSSDSCYTYERPVASLFSQAVGSGAIGHVEQLHQLPTLLHQVAQSFACEVNKLAIPLYLAWKWFATSWVGKVKRINGNFRIDNLCHKEFSYKFESNKETKTAFYRLGTDK